MNEVTQGSVSLGTFKQWSTNANGEVDYSVMHFSNGKKCWNGPKRTTKVQFICASEEKLISVKEPSICVYEMIFQTPRVCYPKILQDIQQRLLQLKDAEEEH